MRKIIAFLLLSGLVVSSCKKKQDNNMKNSLDSLENTLSMERNQMDLLNSEINQITVMLDSIESTEKIIHLNFKEGENTPQTNSERLEAIKNFMAASKTKIENLEKQLGDSNNKYKSYVYFVKKLKKQLEDKEKQIKMMTMQFDSLANVNDQLATRLDEQERVIENMDMEIDGKQRELEELRVMTTKNKAESLFNQAQVTEQLAKKTFFAGKTKKKRYKNAFELYKESYQLGYSPAYDKMNELEPKVK